MEGMVVAQLRVASVEINTEFIPNNLYMELIRLHIRITGESETQNKLELEK